MRLPMFPLGNVVFPFTTITLRVFEPRYMVLLDRVLQGDRQCGIVLIERGFEVGGGDTRFDVGSLVEIIHVLALEGGHKAIVLAGVGRLAVQRWLDDDPHPWAEVTKVPFGEPPAPSEIDRLVALLDRVMVLASELGADAFSRAGLEVAEDPLTAAYQLVATAPLTALDQQRLMAEDEPRRMVAMACTMLADQAELIKARLGG